MSSRHSILVTKVDNEQFNSFRAKRQAERDSKRALLAKEFPLLFGNDAKSRSTIGKYVNKPVPAVTHNPVTPVKRKTQSTLGLKPLVDENVDANGSTVSTTKSANKNRKKSEVFSKVVQSPKKSSRQTIAATTNSRGSFLNYRNFSSQKKPVSEVEMFANEKESESILLKDQDESQLINIDPLQEQVNDVLDYLLETNEVDEGTYRRLSSQAFQKDTLRRLSTRASFSSKMLDDEILNEATTAKTTTTAVESSDDIITASESNTEDASIDIDDMDVLQALRTYISTLDTVPESTIAVNRDSMGVPLIVRAPSRSRNAFGSPAPNTRVISVMSPTGNHFKRPKQLSSPNPIRFPSRSRREDANTDAPQQQSRQEEIGLHDKQSSQKTPPPTLSTSKSSSLVSPNPMRLADAFRRGSVSGRKSIVAMSNKKAPVGQQFMTNMDMSMEEDVLGLMAAIDEPEILNTTKAGNDRRKSKKQRRQSTSGVSLPLNDSNTHAEEDIAIAKVESSHNPDQSFPRNSILNSPSLKTMRVSFFTQTTEKSKTNISTEFSAVSVVEDLIAKEQAELVRAPSEEPGCCSTDKLVSTLDSVVDPEPQSDIKSSAAITDSAQENTGPSNVSSDVLVTTEPEKDIVTPSEPTTTVQVVNDTAPQVKSAITEDEIVVFHPRQMLYMDAMKRGVVLAELSKSIRVDSGSASSSAQNFKYMIHISMLPIPGQPAVYNTLHMVLLKRFSEFRHFYQSLVTCAGANVERIPVLPSRQSVSLG